MSCCKRSNGLTNLSEELEAKLLSINAIFPNSTACIVTPQGQPLATTGLLRSSSSSSSSGGGGSSSSNMKKNKEQNYPRLLMEDLLPVISSLTKMAVQFARTMESDCPVLHVRGAHSLFSCYDLGENNGVLAFFSEVGVAIDAFDTSDADRRMEAVVSDLKIILQNVKKA